MTGGQWLVFWCCIAGLVVVVLSEFCRYRNAARARGLQPHPSTRLREELERHVNDG